MAKHTVIFFCTRIHETDEMPDCLRIENECLQRSIDGTRILLDYTKIAFN